MGLTPGALAFAIVCVLWTSAAGFVAGAVGCLYVRTRRQIEFISLISYVVVMAMCASTGQQIYTIARWNYVKETERHDSIRMAGKSEFFDVGSDKVVKALYYTQIMCYNITGTLLAFWCFFLWAKVWPLRCYWWRSSTYTLVTKVFAVGIACFLTGISQINFFKDKHLARFLVGNILLILVLAITPIFLILILYRCLYYRILSYKALKTGEKQRSSRLQHLHKEGAQSAASSGASGSAGTADVTLELRSFPKEREDQPPQESPRHPRSTTTTTFSTMLMCRFLGAIIVMGGLNIFHIFFQLNRVVHYKKPHTHIKEIPVTTMEQIGETYPFLFSTTQGWLVLVVFGTTEGYWQKFQELIVGIFCCGYARGALRKRRHQEHQREVDRATEASMDNFIRESDSTERGEAPSVDVVEMGITRPALLSNTRASRRQSLPVQSANIQRPSLKHSTSLLASMSKPLPPPPRKVFTPNRLGAASSPPQEPWDFRTSSTTLTY